MEELDINNFQSLTEEQRNKWCSYCGCEGGCNLCITTRNLTKQGGKVNEKETP